jgi:hypothetical protein
MNHHLQYQLAMNRQAELLRQAADHRRVAQARSASSGSQLPASRAPVELPLTWLRSFARQRSAHIS